MQKHYYIVSFLFFLNKCGKYYCDQSKEGDSKFDVLVFSQQWPNTECSIWKRKNSTNKCNMPKNPNNFIVNGFWPLKKGTKGPSSCDNDDKFDRKEIESIINDLKEHWTNLHEDTDSFWSLEWRKHGTCAKPEYNMKDYFKTALDLNSKYKIYDVLKKADISPSTDIYKASDFMDAITKAYGKEPKITCENISENDSLLSEVRLCLDKSLSLIDCSDAGLSEVSCKNENSIKYPDSVL